MFRKTVSQIISAASRSGIDRPMSKKVTEKVDWVMTETSRSKSTASKSSGGNKKKKMNCGEKKHSPCAEKKHSPCAEKKHSPCAEKTVSPCAEKKPSPCAEKTVIPCSETKQSFTETKTHCSEVQKSESIPCSENSDPGVGSKTSPCYHHKDLVPPSSVLSQLKSFELRSDCSSFHLKSTGDGSS